MPRIEVVFFDVGERIVDETRGAVSSRCLFRLSGLAELSGLIKEHNAHQG